jgi:hypothetical protein
MSNTYRTEILNNAGEFIAVGPTVQGRATTARSAAQKAAQWYSVNYGKSITAYRTSASNVMDAGDNFTQPATVILDH